MRRKCTSRAAGHAALTVESKREGNIQNGGREGPFPHKISESTILGVDASSGRENKWQAPKPDTKCCLYPCLAEPVTLPPAEGGII